MSDLENGSTEPTAWFLDPFMRGRIQWVVGLMVVVLLALVAAVLLGVASKDASTVAHSVTSSRSTSSTVPTSAIRSPEAVSSQPAVASASVVSVAEGSTSAITPTIPIETSAVLTIPVQPGATTPAADVLRPLSTSTLPPALTPATTRVPVTTTPATARLTTTVPPTSLATSVPPTAFGADCQQQWQHELTSIAESLKVLFGVVADSPLNDHFLMSDECRRYLFPVG